VSIRRIELPAAIAMEPLEHLLRAFEDACADVTVRVVVLHGTEERFCGGMDLSAMAGEDAAEGLRRFARLLQGLQKAAKPTVAEVSGAAVGGGVGIAAACDVVVAAATSTFSLPEALFGLAPGAILPVLLERMQPQKARLLAFLGQSQSAEWAREHGLVDEVVRPKDVEQAARRWARDLMRVAPQRIGTLRRWIQEIPTLAPETAVLRGAEVTARLVNDPEVRSSVRRFVEEGTAPWTSIDR
jgi:enoyl-CoA hydratase/carnithine racemase